MPPCRVGLGIVAAWTCATIVMVGGAQSPPTSVWQRVWYPPVTLPGTARDQLTFLVGSGGHTARPESEPSHLRLDVQWSARDGVPMPPVIADAEGVSVELYTGDGKVVRPEPSLHHWIGVGNGGGTTMSLISIFPWSANALNEAWFKVRAGGQTWWLELPYGFARNPEDAEVSDPVHDVPRFPPAMSPLGDSDVLVPWLRAEYEIGRIHTGALLSLNISNPFDASASVVEYRPPPTQVGPDTSRQNLDTPRVGVSIDANGQHLVGHELARRLSEDRHTRTDDFTFDHLGRVLRGRGFGTLTVAIDGQEYHVRVPSSLFLYVHGRTDPENSHWMAEPR
jgi:hypothetical protein